MDVRQTAVEIELDADDLSHLIRSGTTTVSDTDSEVKATVKCKDSVQIDVRLPTSEEYDP